MKRCFFVWCMLCVLGAFSLSLAESVAITLDQAIEYTRIHSPLLKSTALNADKADLQIWQSFANFLPQAGFNGFRTYNHELGEIVFKMGSSVNRVKMGTDNNLGGSLRVTQNLFAGGAIWSAYQMSRLNLKVQSEAFANQTHQLLYAVRAAYYQILLLDRLKNVQIEALNRARENLRIIMVLYEAGGASEYEKLRAQVEVSNLEPQLMAIQANNENSRQDLKRIMGINLDDSLILLDTLNIQPPDPELPINDLAALKKIALDLRPDLQQIYWQKKIADYGVKLSFSNYLPKLSYTWQKSVQANADEMKTFHIPAGDWVNSSSSTFNITIPIFTGFKNTATWLESRKNREQISYLLEDKERQVLTQVEQAQRSYLLSRSILDSYTKNLQQAREGYRLANLLFGQKGISQLDLITSQLALTQAETQFLQGLVEYNLSYFQLVLNLGKED